MEPLVSILIPAFDAERWIGDAIQSALGQTRERKEIIIVDSDSTDQTLAIAAFRFKVCKRVAHPPDGAGVSSKTGYSKWKWSQFFHAS